MRWVTCGIGFDTIFWAMSRKENDVTEREMRAEKEQTGLVDLWSRCGLILFLFFALGTWLPTQK